MDSEKQEWWRDHANLARLYRWMDERDEAPDAFHFMAKPWKWAPEWRACLAFDALLPCAVCKGSALEPGSPYVTKCRACGGTGKDGANFFEDVGEAVAAMARAAEVRP